MRILSSENGMKSGTTHDRKFGSALVPGPFMSVGGIVSGPHGLQVEMPSPYRQVHFDDFEGDGLSSRWIQRKGTNNPAAGAPLSGGLGGVCRIPSGAAGTGLAADENELVQTLQYSSQYGGLDFQTRVKLSAITTCWCFFGFTDNAAAVEVPINFATGTTFTTTATDAVGFLFDTTATSKNWWLVGVANDVDAAMQDSAIPPVAAQYQSFRVAVDSSGNASFFINGNPIGTRMATAVTPTIALTPILAIGKLSVAAAMNMDVDYVHTSQMRNVDGGAN